MSITLLPPDLVVLVTAKDEVLGQMDKFAAHRHPAKLHRAVSVWLVNETGQVLLQKRSQKKIVGAGWWGNTICGNVWPGEEYLECAFRRLRVELGMMTQSEAVQKIISLQPLYTFHYKAYANEEFAEHEMDQVFKGKFRKGLVLEPNPDEVSEVLWVDGEELRVQVEKSLQEREISYPQPQETLLWEREALKEKTPPIEVTLQGKNLLLTPWTVMMVLDERLHSVLSPVS